MAIDLDSYRQQSLETWGQMAAGWEQRREWLMEVTGRVNDWLAEHADPKPGQTVLEIAAGTGDLGLRLAERVGGAGRVISTDFAPEMVEVAKRNGAARGLENVEYRVLDAERMDLPDAGADVVVCRFGYMLMADPAAALKESRRVLRPGGPLCFAVWRGPEHNPWAAIPGMTLVQRGHMPPPEPGGPGIFALGDRERTLELVRAAGFADVEIEEISFAFRYADFDDFWDALVRLAGPLARVANALPDDERSATQQAMKDNVASFLSADGSYSVPASAWGVMAR
jgi:SAM-dependent methyltransferase